MHLLNRDQRMICCYMSRTACKQRSVANNLLHILSKFTEALGVGCIFGSKSVALKLWKSSWVKWFAEKTGRFLPIGTITWSVWSKGLGQAMKREWDYRRGMKLIQSACQEDPPSSLKPLQKQQFVMTLSCLFQGSCISWLHRFPDAFVWH